MGRCRLLVGSWKVKKSSYVMEITEKYKNPQLCCDYLLSAMTSKLKILRSNLNVYAKLLQKLNFIFNICLPRFLNHDKHFFFCCTAVIYRLIYSVFICFFSLKFWVWTVITVKMFTSFYLGLYFQRCNSNFENHDFAYPCFKGNYVWITISVAYSNANSRRNKKTYLCFAQSGTICTILKM